MEPFIPASVNNWINSPQGQTMMRKFPLNLAAENLLPPELQKKVFRFVQDNYIWPQVCERQTFEPLWDKVLRLARINLQDIDLNFAVDTNAGKDALEKGSVKVSDSLIFDAIDRLANINHFISFKDGLPMQYVVPEFVVDPYETDVYAPKDARTKAGNALLQWNADNENYYLKHLITCRHHYTYGISFARTEFVLETAVTPRQNNLGQTIQRTEVTRIGATFDPVSVRRLWLNYRIPVHNFKYQPCPFYFEELPYFAILQKQYDPDTNPFGFVNLDKLANANRGFIYSSAETESVRKAMEERVRQIQTQLSGGIENAGTGLAQVLKTEYSVDALWTYYPMLPLDPNTGDWEKYADGRPVPMVRYIMQSYGSNLSTNQVLLRLQRNFYPRDGLPIYGSSQMPDLDSGTYTPCLGELLFNHYKEIVTCTNQFISNKDWINDPPSWVSISSPSAEEDLTRKGANIKVNGPNDFGWRQPYDATASTVNMRSVLRQEAQTTSKAVDAILGKAMGGRTSATEASNAYQASMSGITTDINIFNAGISGGFAERVWDYAGLWFDPDLLKAITGQFGFEMSPEDMWLSVGIQTNVGSNYIASIVRSQNLRYVAESTSGDPSANRANILLELFRELKLGNPKKLVNDGGMEQQVFKATLQAQKTYLGEPVMVAPDQDHNIAIKVKTAFIEDEDSWFNKEHPEAIPALIAQINLHAQFAMLQMQQQLAMMQMQGEGSGGPINPAMTQPSQLAGAMGQLGGGQIPI